MAAEGCVSWRWTKAPGIRNLSDALEDGHSTAGTMGTGWAPFERMSHELRNLFRGIGDSDRLRISGVEERSEE